MCPAAFTDAQAQTTSKSSLSAAAAKKKSPATTPGKSAPTKKPVAKPAVAKASAAAKPKAVAKNTVKAAEKTGTSSKKARTESAASTKKTPGKAVAASTKTSPKTAKPVKPVPDKAVAASSSGKKKPSSAAASPAAKNGRPAATAKAAEKENSGKKKSSSPAEPAAAGKNGSAAVAAGPVMPPVFVPAGAGLRLFGMPTGLPVGLNPASLLASLAAARMPEAPASKSAAPVFVKSKAHSPSPLIDAGTAKAAMEATAKTQSAFRPAVVEVPRKLSPVGQAKPDSLSSAAGPGESGPVAFVTKASPRASSVRLDDFWGFGEFLSPRTASFSLKASESTRQRAGEVTKASNSSVKRGEPAPAPAARSAPKLASSPIPAPPAASPVPVKPPSAMVTGKPVPEAAVAVVAAALPAVADPAGNVKPQSPATKGGPVLASNPPVSKKSQEPEKAFTENEGEDLSERERAFVLSLSQAANRVAASHENHPQEVSETRSEGPRSVPTSALAEKLPETLPVFAAPASGKVDIQSVDQTEHDQANNKVIYTGKVELNSSSVRLRGDRVEVFMKKGGGIERLAASGHVLLRTQATEHGPGRMASAGHADYNLTTGEITLKDSPKVQEEGKSHVSTAPTTVMVLKADGRILTDGPNRTLIGN